MTVLAGQASRVFCDTSFLYACLDDRDVNYPRARVLLEEAATAGIVFYCTWDIISETVTLLRYRCSYSRAIQFLDHVKPTLHIVSYGESVQDQAEEIFRRLAKDKKLSFCDVLSFVVVTALLNRMPCLSFDRDFKRLGLTVIC